MLADELDYVIGVDIATSTSSRSLSHRHDGAGFARHLNERPETVVEAGRGPAGLPFGPTLEMRPAGIEPAAFRSGGERNGRVGLRRAAGLAPLHR